MPVRPAPVAPHIDDPIELLLACHDKVRRFTTLALKVRAHMATAGADAQARDAAQSVLRYFDVAAPLHHADEDEDLYPALRALGDEQLNADLTALSSEHATLGALWQAVRVWLLAGIEGEARPAPDALDTFVQAYTHHAQREEEALYPHAKKLTAAQTAAICAAMVKRRSPP
jgi:hemerythrin-like domain-containing protein